MDKKKSTRNNFTKFSLIAVIFFICVSSIQTNAQVTEKFYNLKVLPKKIEKEKLISIMRNFTSALNVRCIFCHQGDENTPFEKIDFTSDEKPNKDKAREMMRMVQAINKDYIAKISEKSEEAEHEDNDAKVKCVTCHHGQPEPKSLEEVMFKTIKRHGIDDAIDRYHKLYNEYYGGFTFDFRDHTLVKLTEQLIDKKMNDDAVAISKLNLEMYPKSGVAFYGAAMAYEANNDKANAINYYQKALEQMPNNRRIEKKLQELRQ